MGGHSRIVIGAADAAAPRIARLVREARGEVELVSHEPVRAVEISSDLSCDALLLEWTDPTVAALVARARVPVVLVAEELTPELATTMHRTGAAVFLYRHGVDVLREAITRRPAPTDAFMDRAPVGLAALDSEGRIAKSNPAHAHPLGREPGARAGAVEAAARTSESVRALVYVSGADVIFSLRVEDQRFRFVEVNPAFLRATGLASEQVVGRFVDEVIPEPSLSIVLARYREALSERRTVRWEEVTPYPSGTKYGEVSVTPLIDPDGVCRNLVGTVHDVTDVRRGEESIRLYAEIVRSVQIGLTVWDVGDACDPHTIRLRAFNPVSEQMSGLLLAPRVGHTLEEIVAGPQRHDLVELVCDVARSGVTRELRAFRFEDKPDMRTYSLKAFPLTGSAVGLAIDDVTLEVRARALNAVEQVVLEMTAAGRPLEETLGALVRAIEEHAPPAIASVLLVSADGKRVLHGAAPNLPEAYNRAIDGSAVGPCAGSCGTAAHRKRSVIVTDIETDPLWDSYRKVARPYGLRACWSMPIVASNGRVLGTFALYYRETRTPTGEEMDIIARASHVAGIAIQRFELDEQRRGLAARPRGASRGRARG